MTFFPTIELGADGPPRTDLLRALHAGDLGAVRIRRTLEPALAAEVVRRMELAEDVAARWPRIALGVQFQAFSYGLGLDMAEEGLTSYLDRVADFDRTHASILGDVPWRAPIDRALASLADKPVVVPVGPDARPYLAMNLRRLPPGGLIPPHFEIEQTTRPQYAALAEQLDGVTVLSYLLTLRAAEDGGRLAVHQLGWHERDERMFYRGRARLENEILERASTQFALDAGDMLVFDGGRFAHEVTRVGGTRPRWTAGGFLSLARTGDHWLRWT